MSHTSTDSTSSNTTRTLSAAEEDIMATAGPRSPARAEIVQRLLEAGLKRCSGCRAVLPLGDFGTARRKKDGLQTVCRACDSKSTRRWQQANPEKTRKSARKSNRKAYATNPEVRVATAVRRAAYRAMKLRALPLWAYHGDTETDRSALRAAHHAATAAGVRSLVSFTTPDYREALRRIEDEREIVSLLFGETAHIDHRIPLSRGGEHCPRGNLTITSAAFNLSKGDRMPEEWTPPPPVFDQVTHRTYRTHNKPTGEP